MFRNVKLKYGLELTRRFLYTNGKKSMAACAEKKSSKRSSSLLQIPEGSMDSCRLKNHMNLFCEENASPMTTVGCILPAGSMYENRDERGAALFMEHLMFRKTKCRKENEIEEELGEIGGTIKAVATRDMFLFYGTVPNKGVGTLIELFADVMLQGFICQRDFSYEKLAVIKELDDMESKHEKVVMDYLPNTAYQDSDLSKSIYPATSEIRNLTHEKLECFRKRLFRPSCMTMISTGGTSLCDLVHFAGEYFLDSEDNSEETNEECGVIEPVPMPNFRFTGGEMRLRDDDEELGHVAIAIEGPGYANCDDHCTLTVAKELIGSWDQSSGGAQHNAPYIAHRAFNADLCHNYKSFNIGWAKTGLWGCFFSCDRLKLQDMMDMLQREWMRLCTSITEKEVERAVNQCKTKKLLELSDPVQKFYYIACSLFYHGKYESVTDRIMKYEKVNAESLRKIACKYIYDQCPAVVAIGPVENLPDYILIRSGMYLLRY